MYLMPKVPKMETEIARMFQLISSSNTTAHKTSKRKLTNMIRSQNQLQLSCLFLSRTCFSSGSCKNHKALIN